MLSIIIPTYNYDVSELLLALQKQIAPLDVPFEVLICDDHSPDVELCKASEATAKAYGFQFHRNPENLGRSATRDFLSKQAQFDHLLLLDADVLPAKDNFLKTYLELIDDQTIISGGILYQEEKPQNPDERLRWKYGIQKEVRSPELRSKTPHTVVFANLALPKTIFDSCNPASFKRYGLDLLFSECIRQKNYKVLHIDNPAYHLGLESNEVFIDKSKEALRTNLQAEKDGLISLEFRPMQRAYQRLNKFGLTGLFKGLTNPFIKSIEHNLKSANPSILLYNIYRLNYYIKIKNEG